MCSARMRTREKFVAGQRLMPAGRTEYPCRKPGMREEVNRYYAGILSEASPGDLREIRGYGNGGIKGDY